jgi:3-oxoacyl-[acyl-carrier protein] reductase
MSDRMTANLPDTEVMGHPLRKPLAGKLALVTGVSRQVGIGAAIAEGLARAGADIFLTYFQPYDAQMPWGSRPDDIAHILNTLQSHQVRVGSLSADLADIHSPTHIFETARAKLGHVDILVNNAAYSVDCTIQEVTADLIDAHVAVNLRGMILLCQAFVTQWQTHPTQRAGRIINLTSGQGMSPMPGNVAYVATKGAVDAFTVSLATELAGQNITVNAVDPGPTDTGWMSPELKAELLKQAPRGRLGTPEDAAHLICFLASPEAEWITGQIIRSRGGF